MPLRSYYVVLGVPEDADTQTIRRAFKSLARQYHPDVGSGSSPAKFRELAEAYSVLDDTQKRREYDIDLARERRRPGVVPEPLIPSRRVSPIDPFASQFEHPLVDWLDFLEYIFDVRW